MLISALGFADFDGPDVEVIAISANDADRLTSEFCYLAYNEMGFKDIVRPKRRQVRVNGRLFKFGYPQNYTPEGMHGNPTFIDAYYRQDMRFMNCGMDDDEIKRHWKFI
jgi:hypothetical protein